MLAKHKRGDIPLWEQFAWALVSMVLICAVFGCVFYAPSGAKSLACEEWEMICLREAGK